MDIEDAIELSIYTAILSVVLGVIICIVYMFYPNIKVINFLDYSSLFKDPIALLLVMFSLHLSVSIALLIYFPSILIDFCGRVREHQDLDDIHPLYIVLVGPIVEEFIFKFLPYYFFGTIGLIAGLVIWASAHKKFLLVEVFSAVLIVYYPLYIASGPLFGLVLSTIYHCMHNAFELIIYKLAEIKDYY